MLVSDATGFEYCDSELKSLNVLLERQIAIDGDERIKDP